MISSLWTFSLQNEASLSKQEHIRGVWLTNVASEALLSKQNIIETVETCSKLGFNTIYVVTWNRGHTLYPSDIMEKLTGNKIHPVIPDGFDPLDILIKEAKKKDIKVHAWFEFGFAASHRDTTGGILIEKMPHWASRDRIGKITTKNDFQWMNPFHPEVQDFISSLILEVVQKYDVAGIQGDDRLPALPSNGGYDDYTVELYKSEHSGKAPPEYEKDYEWVKWRSSKLTDFLIELVDTLRSVDPNLEISMAPSIYPWAEENYLQDWPSWVNAGLVDKVIPQIYRYDFDAYKKEFNQILLRQISQDQHHIFAPGVLLQVDDYVASEKILKEKINLHREHGIDSEVYFFYEGIKKREEFFKKIYKR
ncbi:MAG: family 10 glycosylhydrolase [Cyclobacteriaceae bacterium]|nr:family 10 glycosylhydrolase [Cyclobacteriaceae bacterium]